MSKTNWQTAAIRARRKREEEIARRERAKYDCRTLNGAINFLTRKKLTRYLSRYSILRTAKMLRITPQRVRRLARKHGIPLPTSRPFPKARDVRGVSRLRGSSATVAQEPMAGTDSKELATTDPGATNADTRAVSYLSVETPVSGSDSTPLEAVANKDDKPSPPAGTLPSATPEPTPTEPSSSPTYPGLPSLEERRRNLEDWEHCRREFERERAEQEQTRCKPISARPARSVSGGKHFGVFIRSKRIP